MIHGSQKYGCQLQSGVNMMHSIPKMIHQKITKIEILMKFYMNMKKCEYNYSQLGSNETISEDIYVLGATTSIKMYIILYTMLTTYFVVPASTKIQEFHRIKPSNEMFHAKSYYRVSKRDSIVVYAKVMNRDMKFGPMICF